MTDYEIAGLLWADRFALKKQQNEAEKKRKEQEKREALLTK